MNLLQQTLSPDTLQTVQAASFELFDKLSSKFFIRLFIDLTSVFVLIRLIFYKNYKKADQYLTFFCFQLGYFLDNLFAQQSRNVDGGRPLVCLLFFRCYVTAPKAFRPKI